MCKFNEVVTEGFTESQSIVLCNAPTLHATLCFVEISFDGRTFLSSLNSSFLVESAAIVQFVQPERCRAHAMCC